MTRYIAFEFCLDQLNIKVRKNELGGVIEIKMPDQDCWIEINKKMNDDLFYEISNHVANRCVRSIKGQLVEYKIPATVRREAILALSARHPPVNLTREWLATIPAKENIGAVDTYLSCYVIDCYNRLANGGFNKTIIKNYYREVVTMMFACWISRTNSPGCHFDKLVVKVGPKNSGIGLGLRLQLPPQMVDAENGEVTPNKAFRANCRISNKKFDCLHNQRCSLGEVTEIDRIMTDKHQSLNPIISSPNDYVLTYNRYSLGGGYVKKLPKHYGLVGVTHNPHFKPYGQGDWRIHPIHLGCRFPGAQEKIPQILDDQWRREIIGHIKWVINKGYKHQLLNDAHDCRELLVN